LGGLGGGGGPGREMTQALYAHMNNKTIKKIQIYEYVENRFNEITAENFQNLRK
jgi:hypothetical protein